MATLRYYRLDAKARVVTEDENGHSVLDMRSKTAFESLRLRGSICIPHEEWLDRRMELSARGEPYIVLYDPLDPKCTEAARDIASRFATDVQDTIDATILLAPGARNFVESGAYPDSIQPRLWRPGPLCTELVSRLRVGEWLRPSDGNSLDVLDAGSGMARNAIYLGLEIPKALSEYDNSPRAGPAARIVAVDNRRHMEKLALQFAGRMGLAGRILPVTSDFSDFLDMCTKSRVDTEANPSHASEPTCFRPFDVVLYARFMDKPALRRIGSVMREDSPSLLLIEHFHVSTDHPSDRGQTIAEGEALALVSESDASVAQWETLLEQPCVAEDGRPMLQVVLRRSPIMSFAAPASR